jgi:hypothetical protein
VAQEAWGLGLSPSTAEKKIYTHQMQKYVNKGLFCWDVNTKWYKKISHHTQNL